MSTIIAPEDIFLDTEEYDKFDSEEHNKSNNEEYDNKYDEFLKEVTTSFNAFVQEVDDVNFKLFRLTARLRKLFKDNNYRTILVILNKQHSSFKDVHSYVSIKKDIERLALWTEIRRNYFDWIKLEIEKIFDKAICDQVYRDKIKKLREAKKLLEESGIAEDDIKIEDLEVKDVEVGDIKIEDLKIEDKEYLDIKITKFIALLKKNPTLGDRKSILEGHERTIFRTQEQLCTHLSNDEVRGAYKWIIHQLKVAESKSQRISHI